MHGADAAARKVKRWTDRLASRSAHLRGARLPTLTGLLYPAADRKRAFMSSATKAFTKRAFCASGRNRRMLLK